MSIAKWLCLDCNFVEWTLIIIYTKMYTQNTYSDYFHENCRLQSTYYVVKVSYVFRTKPIARERIRIHKPDTIIVTDKIYTSEQVK